MAIQRTIINAIASLALLLSGAAVGFAHAELTRAMPPAGGNVAVAPNEVAVNFSEQLEPAFSTIVVRDSVGKQVDKADAHVDKEDRTIMRVSLQPLPRGTYTVKWRAVTVDTHRTEGAFIFRVGE
jgi:methionine-rich copper-binding protein CopC